MAARILVLLLVIAPAIVGCSVDRSATGLCPPGPCDLVPVDAWAGDGSSIPDTGSVDPDAFMSMADAGDADMPDAYTMPPDDGGMDGGFDAGEDPGSDAGEDAATVGTDGGPPSPLLRIRFHGALGGEGIVWRIVYTGGIPATRHEIGWFFDTCWGGTTYPDSDTAECLAYDYEMRSGRYVEFFPVRSIGSMMSFCDATSCPGTFDVEWMGAAVVPITTIPNNFDSNHDGFTTGDPATLQVRIP